MAASTSSAKSAGPLPRPPDRVRNVVLVGRTGAGKTTLVEALLAASGTIPRAGRVEDGSTVSDSTDLERRQHRSVSLALAPLEHEGVKVNLLDAPGHVDFVAELRAGLRAADAALFLVPAFEGVDARCRQLWQECVDAGLPRVVVVTQLDRPRADVEQTVRACRAAFGEGVHPVELPLAEGLLDLLTLRVHPAGASERDATAEERAAAQAARAELLEGVIAESEDEELLEHYLEGDELDADVLTADLEKAVASGHLHPVLPVCATTGSGVRELLDLLVHAFPSPLERPTPPTSPVAALACDPDGPLLAQVVRTGTDPYLGRVALVRVFSGTLRPDAAVHVSGERGSVDRHEAAERTGPLATPLGSAARALAHCPAGDLCTVARLGAVRTGDSLSGVERPLRLQPWPLPEPQLPVAVAAAVPSDEDRLDDALARVAVEDPSVRVERNAETGQLLLWCLGEAHVEVLLDRLGVAVQRPAVRVALRETLAGPVTATGRLVKQSGGHGQYAVVVVQVSPLPAGEGIRFESRVVGGAVPTNYIGSVEKGVRGQAERGVHDGNPLVDLQVVLVDGKAHAVDSSDAAFAAAGALALREAAAAAGTTVLEPVSEVEVTVPPEAVGAVMSDLAGRRARVTGSEPAGDSTVVRAEVPDSELLRYALELRALTHGIGTYRRRHLRYEATHRALAGSRA
ncbi:MAG TPA: elongation factor G-like protein EF-G2 [Mycobacteriales bacterium]|jgi:elongation factor G|nr:elongation factor G-like protein EF-G2 [Mycobacteriales bacterium]